MSDFKITVDTKVNTNDIQSQLDKQRLTINHIDVNPSAIQSIVRAISDGISRGIRINLDNIRVGNSGASIGKQIADNFQRSFSNSVTSVVRSGLFDSTKVFGRGNDAARQAQAFYDAMSKSAGIGKKVTISESFGDAGDLNGFTVNIEHMSGAVERLRYALNEAGTAFQFMGSSANDAKVFSNLEKQATQTAKTITSFETKLKDLKAAYPNVTIDETGFLTLLNSFRQGTVDVQQLTDAFRDLKSQAQSLNSIQSGLSKTENTIMSYQAKMTSLAEGTDSYNIANSSLLKLQGAKTNVENAIGAYNASPTLDNYNRVIEANTRLQKALRSTAIEFNNVYNAENKSLSAGARASATKSFESYFQRNTKAARVYATEVEDLRKKLSEVQTAGQLKQWKAEFTDFQTKVIQEGNTGKTIVGELSALTSGLSGVFKMFVGGQVAVTALRSMYTNVYQVNQAMVDLRKVSGASQQQVSAYFDQAADSAKKYGAAIKDVVATTTDWARLN